MRLRLITGTLLAFGFALLLAWPWLIGPRPDPAAPAPVVRTYLTRTAVYVGVLVTTLVAAGICSMLILRRTREEYSAQAGENLRSLVEGTLQDHRRGSSRDE
jgi:hypothetical protein